MVSALSESSDNVKSKRQFSQESCELQISHTGQTVGEVPKWEDKNIERLTVVTACARDTSQWTQITFFFRWPYGTLTVKWGESFFSAKGLSQIMICFTVANSNRVFQRVKWKAWSHWHNKYCTRDIVFYKDIFAYKCPPPFLCQVIFSQIWLSLSPQSQYTEKLTVSV